jgi:site-specific DNA recombinase
MARAGEFDVLVVRELDRFARGLAKQLVIESEFKRAGVEVEYVLGEYPDTPEGALMKNVRAVIAEYERLKINERTTRGRRLKVQAGNVMVCQHAPYGYRVAEKDGKTTLEIYEPEAAIVRLVFQWYTGDGECGPMSICAIAGKLSAMSVPTYVDSGARPLAAKKERAYGVWGRPAIQRILKNETCAGRWLFGKENRQRKKNPDSHLLSVSVPAIVSRETWEAAQERLAENRVSLRCKPKHEYLLSRRITCGRCGSKMEGGSTVHPRAIYLHYRCPATLKRSDLAHDCDAPGYSTIRVDSAVWDWLKEKLADPDRLATGLEEYRTEQDKANEPLRARLAVVDSLIDDNQRQLEKLLDLYLAGDFPKEMLTDRKTRLETTIDALGKERAGLAASLEAVTLTGEQIQTIQDFAAEVRGGLESADFATRRGVIELLNVTVTLAVEDGVKVVYPRCMLPGGRKVLSIDQYHNTTRQ